MTRGLFAACALVFACAGPAHAQSAALLGNVDFAVDASGLHVSSVRLGGLYPFGAYTDRIGVPMQTTPYLQAGAARDAGSALGLWRDAGAATAGVDAEAGVVHAGGHMRTVGDATWRLRPAANTSVELVAAGDLVGTPDAADRGIGYGFVGSRVAQSVERFTAVGLVGYQSFTDGNDRLHVRAALVWQALPEYGLNMQVRWQRYGSRSDDAAGYFNPGCYSQAQFAAGVRRRLGAWTLSAALGGGIETIDAADSRPVRTVELRGEGALTDHLRLALYAGYDHSASYGESADNSSQKVGATLVWPF